MAQHTRMKNRSKVANGGKAGKTIAEYPILVQQWHPTKNGSLKPQDVTAGSRKKIWWKCHAAPDHEWEAPANRRTRPSQCPFCVGIRLSVTNRLDTCVPFLLEEWDYQKNGDLTPDKAYVGSLQKVWWKCPKGPDHEWQATVHHRARVGNKCPFCANLKLSVTNRLDMVAPYLMPEWDFERNGLLLPNQVVYASRKKVWWRCLKGPDHVWQARVDGRVIGYGCPFCRGLRTSVTNSLASCLPKVARQWHPTKNGNLTPHDVTSHSDKRVWWRCTKGADHEWEMEVDKRAHGEKCPFCGRSSRYFSPSSTLAGRAPHLVAEWHPTKNENVRPEDLRYRSRFAAWWKCPKGPDHEWQAIVGSRTGPHPNGCPFCSSVRVSVTNSLATCYPLVAAQWHPTKNGALRPDQVVAGSSKPFYWRCEEGHEWVTPVAYRTRRERGCPHCPRRKRKVATT
jgi:Zn finger protein HypA/HybF involved in hydrogenase expression